MLILGVVLLSHVNTSNKNKHTYWYTHTHTHTHTQAAAKLDEAGIDLISTCDINTSGCFHTGSPTHTLSLSLSHTHTYAHTYTHTHTHTHTHTLNNLVIIVRANHTLPVPWILNPQ